MEVSNPSPSHSSTPQIPRPDKGSLSDSCSAPSLVEIATTILCTCFPLMPRFTTLVLDRFRKAKSSSHPSTHGERSNPISRGLRMSRNNKKVSARGFDEGGEETKRLKEVTNILLREYVWVHSENSGALSGAGVAKSGFGEDSVELVSQDPLDAERKTEPMI